MRPNRRSETRFGRSLTWQFVGLVLLSISCQSTASLVGDQYYESGRYPQAEAAYVNYLESSSADEEVASRALFRLGVIYATPKSPLHDPERSIEVLELLATTYPESRYTSEALLLRNLLLQPLELAPERKQELLQVEELRSELTRRQSEVFLLQKQLSVKEGELTDLRESIPPLEAQIQDLLEQLKAKELELEQLDRLKAIDLEAPPPRENR